MRRRELLLALAGAAALPSAARAATTEGSVLLDLMHREQSAKLAYTAALKTLGAGAPSELVTLRSHEADHADALATQLAAVGLARPLAPRLQGTAAAVAAAGSRSEVVTAGIALEQELVDAYRRALAGLPDAKVAMTAATILASHVQHHLILRMAAGESDG